MGILWSLLGYSSEDPGRDVVDPVTGLTPREKQAIQESWKPLRANMKTVGTKFFIKLFTEFPKFKELFESFKKIEITDLENSPKLKAHGTTFMLSMTNVVEHLDDPDVIIELCTKLGNSHKRFNLEEKDFTVVVGLFLQYFSDNYPGVSSESKEFVCTAYKKAMNLVVQLISKNL